MYVILVLSSFDFLYISYCRASNQVLQLEEANEVETDATGEMEPSAEPWHLIYEEEKKEIIMLWHLCHVSIIHRTQFYLLFKGDPADRIYMEVELRRLTWLEQQLSDVGNASPALLGDEPASTVSARYLFKPVSIWNAYLLSHD